MPYLIDHPYDKEKISVCFLEKSTQDSTDILEPMLIILHDGRGTSIMLHPNLPDVRSSSFTASVLLMLQNNFACFTGEAGSLQLL
ncbi:hypothetical protein DAPPUDRAFT_311336 [Daphnia pulex]|uniref:Uncharacterized protein n=1 Tax=Daphnia pulex TaxID=6669 RepID=E9FWK7_DAPPU|nr:hypothetical protein DAPPUDRAFT_311336 [Daphnia pulex]|eukprot:EFX87912.1 hypothetical protein DAPPUDRAFT_311336 [Daphnia pulex]